MHEIGHVIGLDHVDGDELHADVMAATLLPGVRRFPAALSDSSRSTKSYGGRLSKATEFAIDGLNPSASSLVLGVWSGLPTPLRDPNTAEADLELLELSFENLERSLRINGEDVDKNLLSFHAWHSDKSLFVGDDTRHRSRKIDTFLVASLDINADIIFEELGNKGDLETDLLFADMFGVI